MHTISKINRILCVSRKKILRSNGSSGSVCFKVEKLEFKKKSGDIGGYMSIYGLLIYLGRDPFRIEYLPTP